MYENARSGWSNSVTFALVRSYRFASGLLTDSLGYDMKSAFSLFADVIRGTDVPVTAASRRKPAWTDRILHVASPTLQVEDLAYTSHPELTMSDHKPVSADCNVHVRLSLGFFRRWLLYRHSKRKD